VQPASFLPIHLAVLAGAAEETLELLVEAWPGSLAETAPRVAVRTGGGSSFVVGALPLHLATVQAAAARAGVAVRLLLRHHPAAADATCEAQMVTARRLACHIRSRPALSPYIVCRALPLHLAVVHGCAEDVVAALLGARPDSAAVALQPRFGTADLDPQAPAYAKDRATVRARLRRSHCPAVPQSSSFFHGGFVLSCPFRNSSVSSCSPAARGATTSRCTPRCSHRGRARAPSARCCGSTPRRPARRAGRSTTWTARARAVTLTGFEPAPSLRALRENP
jgi:hypothetical protein